MQKELAPVCEVTGLPLPILPPKPHENGAFLYPHLPNNLSPNEHHTWYSEKKLKNLGLKGEALQSSRVQSVDWYYHTNYHNIFKKGPILPEIEDEIFRLGVLASAGAIPKMAVDVSKLGEFETVELSDQEHFRIASQIKIDQTKPIARFLVDYTSRQKLLDVVDEIQIEEFLDNCTDSVRKQEIARLLLGGAIEMSLENAGLFNQEKELKHQGLVPGRKAKTFYWTTKKIIRIGHFSYFADRLENQLSQA